MSEKWWDMSDDELDDLFREASDKAEIPFDSSALDKLRQKIDLKPTLTPEPSQGFQKRWIALLGLLIFVGVALLYTFSGKKEDSKQDNNSDKIADNTLSSSKNVAPKTANKNSDKADENTLPSSIDNKKSEVVIDKIAKNTLPSSVNNKKTAVVVDKSNSSETKESKGNSTDANLTESKIAQNKNLKIIVTPTYEKGVKRTYSFKNKSLNEENSNSISEDNLLKNNPLDISNNKKEATEIIELSNNNSTVIGENSNGIETKSISNFSETKSKKSKVKKSENNGNEVDNSSVYSEINALMLKPILIPENKLIEEDVIVRSNFYNVDFLKNKPIKPFEINIQSESPTYVDAPPIVMKQPKFSRFGIRLAIAPDINSLERLSTSVLGSSAGVLLEYRFSKKFILQTGVTFSNKKYTGNFDDYRNWANNWKSYHPSKPTSVDGGCKIIDVPINIRFNIYQKPRNTFFISTGVSNYFMMNETYTYNYAWAPERTVEWNDKSSYYWSTINISAGIERKLTKHFTFQIEPYLKTPLSNVGRGGVNLYSSGLLFSTKYEF